MDFRPAEAKDIPALVGLLKQLTELEADFAFDEAAHRRGLELLISHQPACCVMVAEEASRIVGLATGQFVISTACGAPSLWVEDVVIQRELRGQGLGRKILGELEAWARAQGAARMQLLADRDNEPALNFYRQNGWQGTNFICLRKML